MLQPFKESMWGVGACARGSAVPGKRWYVLLAWRRSEKGLRPSALRAGLLPTVSGSFGRDQLVLIGGPAALGVPLAASRRVRPQRPLLRLPDLPRGEAQGQHVPALFSARACLALTRTSAHNNLCICAGERVRCVLCVNVGA